MIKTDKNVYDCCTPDKDPADGFISLIVRRPKNADEEGCNYHEYESNLSPSKKLLDDYQYGWKYGRPMKWEEFKEEFKKEIIGNADAQKKIREFANRCVKGEPITLLCYCKNKNKCHRFIIKEFIEREKRREEGNNKMIKLNINKLIIQSHYQLKNKSTILLIVLIATFAAITVMKFVVATATTAEDNEISLLRDGNSNIATTTDLHDLVIVPYYTFCLDDSSTLNNPVVGEWCEQIFPEHNIGYCNRNLYDCIGEDYVMPSRYDNGSWYYPLPDDNSYPPAPNTYGQRVDENGETQCYDFNLKRTIDNDYCEDIEEESSIESEDRAPEEEISPIDNNLTNEWGFAYCPPRVACVDNHDAKSRIDTELSSSSVGTAEEEVDKKKSDSQAFALILPV